MRVYVERLVTPEDMSKAALHSGKLRMAYSEYEEEGEEYSTWIREELPPAIVRKLLSRRISELLTLLSQKSTLNITQLAGQLQRSPSNVHRDLALLRKYRLITFIDRGREKIPFLLARRIIIEI